MRNVPEEADLELLRDIVGALEDKKAADIVVFDVRKSSSIVEYYVLATGMNAPHLKALGNMVRARVKTCGLSCCRQSGTPQSGWIAVDCLGVMIHLLSAGAREYYALDSLWSAAPRLVVQVG